MFINTSTPLTDLSGAALMDGDKELTFATVACNALLSSHQQDTNASGEEKFKLFQLASKLHGQTMPVEINVEEAALIKKRVAMFYGPLVVGRVFQAIEA